jgi:CBS domain-containing protein
MPKSPVGKKRSDKEMTRHVLCALVDDRVEDAYELMQDIHCRHLPVVKDGKLIGIISDRDILLRATYGEGGIKFPDIKVGDIMTKGVISCRPSARLSAVAELMVAKEIDSMPVTDEKNHLLGIITSTDLLRVMQESKQTDGGDDTVLDLLSLPKGSV